MNDRAQGDPDVLHFALALQRGPGDPTPADFWLTRAPLGGRIVIPSLSIDTALNATLPAAKDGSTTLRSSTWPGVEITFKDARQTQHGGGDKIDGTLRTVRGNGAGVDDWRWTLVGTRMTSRSDE
jgi:hypothetical protein